MDTQHNQVTTEELQWWDQDSDCKYRTINLTDDLEL